MGDFRNEVGYSASKRKMLDVCKRRFLYYCYTYWRGWWNRGRPPKDKRAESAYNSKHVENRWSWSGKVVHAQAAWGLKTAMEGRRWTRENLRNAMLERAANDVTVGLKQAKEQESGNPKYRVQLTEIMRGEEIDEEYVRDRVRNGVLSLTSVDEAWIGLKKSVNLYVRATERRERIVMVEDLVSFQRKGVKVWLSIDLMMRGAINPTEQCVITDWKTGRPRDEDEEQVHLYRTFALDRGWKDATMLLVYLHGDRTRVKHIAPEGDSVAITDAAISEYIERLRPMLIDGDLQKNQPIESKFESTPNHEDCVDCSFQRLCERDGTKPSAGP